MNKNYKNVYSYSHTDGFTLERNSVRFRIISTSSRRKYVFHRGIVNFCGPSTEEFVANEQSPEFPASTTMSMCYPAHDTFEGKRLKRRGLLVALQSN